MRWGGGEGSEIKGKIIYFDKIKGAFVHKERKKKTFNLSVMSGS